MFFNTWLNIHEYRDISHLAYQKLWSDTIGSLAAHDTHVLIHLISLNIPPQKLSSLLVPISAIQSVKARDERLPPPLLLTWRTLRRRQLCYLMGPSLPSGARNRLKLTTTQWIGATMGSPLSLDCCVMRWDCRTCDARPRIFSFERCPSASLSPLSSSLSSSLPVPSGQK